MTVRGIDYSFARPGGKAIRKAGFEFVVRYINYPGAGGKALTADELADLRANGLAVVLVFESTDGRALDGEGAGRADAAQALFAAGEFGFPDDRPIYFAVDFDAQPNDYAAIERYFDGVADVLPRRTRIGVYGSFAVVEMCARQGLAGWYWQTYAWSSGRRSAMAHIYQYRNGQELNGGAVDYNEAYGADYGQWPAEGGLGMEDKERLARLERLLGANGIDYEGERLVGEAALDRADKQGWSAFLGIGQLRAETALANDWIEGHGDPHGTRMVPPIPDHKHTPGGVETP